LGRSAARSAIPCRWLPDRSALSSRGEGCARVGAHAAERGTPGRASRMHATTWHCSRHFLSPRPSAAAHERGKADRTPKIGMKTVSVAVTTACSATGRSATQLRDDQAGVQRSSGRGAGLPYAGRAPTGFPWIVEHSLAPISSQTPRDWLVQRT
jgi:hypothetical protein